MAPLLIKTLIKLGRVDEAQDYCRRGLTIVHKDAYLQALSDRLTLPLEQQKEFAVKRGTIRRIIQRTWGYPYGFIVLDGSSEDIYFQVSDIHWAALPYLAEGARVECEVLQIGQNVRIINVRIRGCLKSQIS